MNESILSSWLKIERQGSAKPMPVPSIEDWMSASRQDLARVVDGAQITVLVPSDGSRRHFLLRQLKQKNNSSEARDYLSAMGAQLVGLFRLLFSCGVKNILCPILQSPNFERGMDYIRTAAQSTSAVLAGEAFTRFYRDWNAEAHLYGGWDVLHGGEAVRETLQALNQKFEAFPNPGSQRKILYGFCPGTFVDEMCARVALYATKNKTYPSAEQLRQACFPFGPDKLDLVINTDLMRAGYIVPPVLDKGTHYYHLGYIPYDLSEQNLRQILYDYLFVRHPEPQEGANYSENELARIQEAIAENKNRVVGLGQRVGAGMWQIQ